MKLSCMATDSLSAELVEVIQNNQDATCEQLNAWGLLSGEFLLLISTEFVIQYVH